MAEQIQSSVALKKSSYSDFITEAERLVKLKEGYEGEVKSADLFRASDRANIISQMRIMMGELAYMFTQEENEQVQTLADILDNKSLAIESIQDYINTTGNANGQAILREEISFFRRNCYVFL